MKKWAITGALVLCLLALGFTAKVWVPWLLLFALQNKEHVEQLNTLAELASKAVSWAAAVFLFIWRLWRDKQERDATRAPIVTVRDSPAGRDVIAAGGEVQTGGVEARAQRDLSVDGDLVRGNKTVVYQTPAATPAPVLSPLHQLPPSPADFTGRADDLRELRDAIEAGGVTISGLQGQGGVGKTALALKLAEKLSPQYPEAQIYVDLRGVSEKPLASAEAMAHVIRAFQPEAKLPEKDDELCGLYRSVLHGKRALLLMDNARDSEQVRPLIPPAGCVLLVTSRQHFTLPGLHAKNLETLPPPEAKELLLRIAPRVDGEAEAIAKLCGYLPLALRLTATVLAEHADLDPAGYAKRLANEKNRLKLLAGGNESVEASINLSYGLLDSEIQKRWRMLAVFPDTFDAPAAAAVWEMEGDAAQDTLSRLTQYSMLEWNDTAGRYRLHDLMRHFASARLQPSEQDQAALRHSTYYLAVLGAADELYLKGGESLMRGLARFDVERGNVHAGQAWAADHALTNDEAARLCISYPDAGVYCLALRQHPGDLIRWLEVALVAARRLKDRIREGGLLGNLGAAYSLSGGFRHAIEHHERSLAIKRETGDPRGEANSLGNLGNAYLALGDCRRAIEHYEQAFAIERKIGDRRGEGNALGNLGLAYADLGDTRRAIEHLEQALVIDRGIGDRKGEASDLGNLGAAYLALGEYRAIEYSEQALGIAREIGDHRREGGSLGNLGVAHKNLGDYRRAIEHYGQQLAIVCQIGDRQGEGNSLWNMSLALDKLGERKQAIGHAEAALKIFEEIEAPDTEKVGKQIEQWKRT